MKKLEHKLHVPLFPPALARRLLIGGVFPLNSAAIFLAQLNPIRLSCCSILVPRDASGKFRQESKMRGDGECEQTEAAVRGRG